MFFLGSWCLGIWSLGNWFLYVWLTIRKWHIPKWLMFAEHLFFRKCKILAMSLIKREILSHSIYKFKGTFEKKKIPNSHSNVPCEFCFSMKYDNIVPMKKLLFHLSFENSNQTYKISQFFHWSHFPSSSREPSKSLMFLMG